MLDLLVIGGGPAGVTAALRGRELGAEVALVDRDGLGGTCTNDGCVPTRVLAHAARLVRDAGQFAQYGLVGEAPMVDFARVLAAARETVTRIHDKKRLTRHLDEMGVRLVRQSGGARFTDANTLICADGTQFQARKIVLATGGHARRLPFPGAEHALTHSDVWTMTHLPRSIVIVGGAATGCQLASVFAAFGTRVTMLEVGPRLLGIEDEAVSQGIEQAFARRGIEIIRQIGSIDHLHRHPNGTLQLAYTREDELHDIETETVLLAVGWQANSAELGLNAVGVECEHGYIRVNDSLQTSAPHIFACGDVTGRMMLVQSAIAEGVLAAEGAMLGPGGRGTHRIVPHGGFTDPEYGSVGLTEAQARAQEDCAVAVVPYAHCDRAAIDGRTEGLCKLIVSKSSHRMLGVHIVGEQAVEILQVVAAGMAADMWVEQLAELELAYPTFAAVVGLAARQIMRDLGEVPLASQWRERGYSAATEWEHSNS
jgi:pyruvate/2-oxoglutarate dehydrogenase complex dihydrolipoamide dehydrogenase (E3) component